VHHGTIASWASAASRSAALTAARIAQGELFGVAESGGDRDVEEFYFRDGIQHHRIHHPRHRFNIPDFIRQSASSHVTIA
jgi:hypothetical protein